MCKRSYLPLTVVKTYNLRKKKKFIGESPMQSKDTYFNHVHLQQLSGKMLLPFFS